MHHWSQFSQPNVSKSNFYRKTNTNSSCTGVCRYHKYFKRKKLSINACYRLPVSPSTSPLVTLFARRGHPHSMHQHEKSQDAAHFCITRSLPWIITFGTHLDQRRTVESRQTTLCTVNDRSLRNLNKLVKNCPLGFLGYTGSQEFVSLHWSDWAQCALCTELLSYDRSQRKKEIYSS